MSKLTVASSLATLVALAGALAGACGGQSFTGDGRGASDAGGAANNAGASSSAGQTQAGTGSGGGVTAGATSGGMSSSGASNGGAPADDACSGAATSGPDSCNAIFEYWTHDADSGLCIPYFYGGCGKTKNLYQTLDECQAACPGGTPNYDACEVATDCVLGSGGCCGVCDGPDVSTHDFIAYNKKYAGQVALCGDVACGACPPPQSDGALKYFLANCVRGQCIVEDLRVSSLTACKTVADCELRVGTACCPGCDGADLISVRSDGSFEKLVCGDEPSACPGCAPSTVGAAACQAGHCAVELPAKRRAH